MSGAGSRSVTARVVGLVALVTLASSLLVGVALVRTQSEANVERASDTLALQADNLAGRLAAGRPLAAGPLLARLTRQGVAVDVARPGAAPPAPFTTDDIASAGAGSEPVRRASGKVTWLVAARPVGDGRTVLLGRRLAQAGGLTSEQQRRAVLVVLGVLAVGVLGGVALAQGITRPLRRVSAVALRLTAGERDVRVGPGGPREVAEVGAALDGLAERLTESEDRQRRFLETVGHELRTPLTAVTGYAEALADGVLAAAGGPGGRRSRPQRGAPAAAPRRRPDGACARAGRGLRGDHGGDGPRDPDGGGSGRLAPPGRGRRRVPASRGTGRGRGRPGPTESASGKPSTRWSTTR